MFGVCAISLHAMRGLIRVVVNMGVGIYCGLQRGYLF
jgi:hypothetical protein